MRISMSILAVCAVPLMCGGALGCSKTEASEKAPPTSAPSVEPPPPAPKAEAPAPAPSAAPTSGDKAVTEIELASVAETMTFNKTALTVKTGQKVHLVLTNNAKSPLMPHNWVLTKPGTEAAVALAGVNLKTDGYVASGDANIVAATPLAQPGKTSEITFTAPAPGTYPYICTVPGHYILMKGKLTVTP